MRRLYRQFYLAIVAALVLVVLFGGIMWRFAPKPAATEEAFEMAGEMVATLLPSADHGVAAQQQAIDRLHNRLKIDIALFDSKHQRIAAAGRAVPRPQRESGGWLYGAGGPAWAVRLPDDRWVVARIPGRRGPPLLSIIGFLGGIAVAVAICAYPLVRRLTRRLERLQAGVEQLGAGDLAARVKIEGKDEVARLAESFNCAAARIEELVGSHKLLLANASHELRTPLSRIRLGVEFLKETADPKRKRELERDIAELDQLIDEILLSSRLDAVKGLDQREEVDLLALAAEEGIRYDLCSVGGEPVVVRGDRALLRRMTRNLIENAERHGKPPIEVEVGRAGAQGTITVSDHGAGVAASERERVFSPFFRILGDHASSGTGLGLTLVRQIARQHGGEALWVGTPERPSRIRVVLPMGRQDG
ncbi:MAG: HAMP domain-containing histidine kinase [Hyphomonadaceae bacterium]|jgi:signal transduction histidine kinase|nr:HAMP domain-containing histidine kinase [Hyphomonadaceae bacterium]